MSVTVKFLDRKKVGQGHKANLQRMHRTITILGLTLSTSPTTENSLWCKMLTDGRQFMLKSLEREKEVKVSRSHCMLKIYAEDSYYATFYTHSYHYYSEFYFLCKSMTDGWTDANLNSYV